MLLFVRRITLFGAIALAPFACSAPDTKGLFDASEGDDDDSNVPVGCLARCANAALRCTLIDAPCDAICALKLNDNQLNCLTQTPCNLQNGSIVDNCLGAGAAVGVMGARCECTGETSCNNGGCRDGLLCFDPGGLNIDEPPLFPGFCSKRCNPSSGPGCPEGFVCREQVFNDAPLDGDDRYWCER